MPSSVIAFAHYDERQKCLDIVYRSGKTYRYLDVPDKIYRAYLEAFSKGKYLNEIIKKNYRFQKLGPLKLA